MYAEQTAVLAAKARAKVVTEPRRGYGHACVAGTAVSQHTHRSGKSKVSGTLRNNWLRIRVGLVEVLHTWGRNLAYHPHVHFLVPAGAWDGQVWRYGRSRRFFLPVRALSSLFRAKFRDALQKHDCFQQLPPSVWSQDWVVHSQPVGRGLRALRYLAPYIFQVAISNSRLVAFRMMRFLFAIGRLALVSGVCVRCHLLSLYAASCSMCCPRALLKCVTMAFSALVNAVCCVKLWLGLRHQSLMHPHHQRHPRQRNKQRQYIHPPSCPHCGQPLHLTQRLMPLKRRRQPH
ncbi:MAG: hypothetical protein GY805_20985 [Chloroflexi bacterium]|nr:hypothetical protein [Chloroflexota bacterium]